ncbi:MAG TPA: DUF3006 domain-containing protein [Ruminococcaceae bacterium]|jgi:hypothetical protein|nr:DUF3006 domain-containing protein [Oscillospiraceae bacterium]
MKYTIDRFEGEFAVVELESGKFADIPREAIPEAAHEGDIISVSIDSSATKNAKKDIRKLEDSLWAD